MSKTIRIKKIINELTTGLHEREEIIAVAFLAAVSGQNTFLLGPPGTAKSLISRRIACAFKDADYFEYLMNRFSTPEEVFGPVSIKALKEDNYTRKTSGYLPTVDFAFLDEIWKSSPAILNALLTLVNERIFRNGGNTEKAPLKALISASNETPPENQGLEALYDRFLVRLFVGPLTDRSNFESLINSKPTNAQVELDEKMTISNDEWSEWQKNIHNVSLSKETITIINLIRNALNHLEDKEAVYVSDRMWQRASLLLKTSAFLCDRDTTNLSDTLLLRHCLWTTEQNRDSVVKIVEDAVQKSGLPTDVDIAELDKEKERLDQDIHTEFYYSDDIYDTQKMSDRQFLKVQPNLLQLTYDDDNLFYIPIEKMKSSNDFHPIDTRGNEISRLTCTFDSQGSCTIKDDEGYRYHYGNKKDEVIFKPTILFHKGDKKTELRERVLKAFATDTIDLQKQFKAALEKINNQKTKVEQHLDIPFVPAEVRELAYKSITDQIRSLNVRIKDCDLMLEKIGAEIKLDKAS